MDWVRERGVAHAYAIDYTAVTVPDTASYIRG
jgi:hypothetical protein